MPYRAGPIVARVQREFEPEALTSMGIVSQTAVDIVRERRDLNSHEPAFHRDAIALVHSTYKEREDSDAS